LLRGKESWPRCVRIARTRAEVLGACAGWTAATLDELTPVVYDDVAVERHRWGAPDLGAHLIKLAREHRASECGGLWRLTQR